jgi:hypothetical protein
MQPLGNVRARPPRYRFLCSGEKMNRAAALVATATLLMFAHSCKTGSWDKAVDDLGRMGGLGNVILLKTMSQ